MSQQRVDPNFEREVNKLRLKISKNMGSNITFIEATRIIGRMMNGINVEVNIKQIPKSKLQEIKMKVRRRKKRK